MKRLLVLQLHLRQLSRLSVADYIADLIENPTKDVKANVGLDKAGTDGDKPAWY